MDFKTKLMMNKKKFGNINLYSNGVFNKSSIGIYFTTFIIILTCLVMIIIINHSIENFSVNLMISLGTYVFSILTITMCLIVCFSDPGFIAEGNLEEKEYDKLVPLAVVQERNFMLKYCYTCKIVRDLRVFHCKVCNLCIMRHGKV